MKSLKIDINVQVGNGNKEFEVYTMDLTKNTLKLMQITDPRILKN